MPVRDKISQPCDKGFLHFLPVSVTMVWNSHFCLISRVEDERAHAQLYLYDATGDSCGSFKAGAIGREVLFLLRAALLTTTSTTATPSDRPPLPCPSAPTAPAQDNSGRCVEGGGGSTRAWLGRSGKTRREHMLSKRNLL